MIINQVVSGGGTTPTGTKSITANGVYDVTDFASADVQVPTTAPAHYIEKTVDANGKLVGASNVIDLTGITDIGPFVLAEAYRGNTGLPNAIDLSSLTQLSGGYACSQTFQNCNGIRSVDLRNLVTISGPNACYNMFYYINTLETVVLDSLTTISGDSCCNGMLSSCASLQNVSLPNLTTISASNACQYMFSGTNISSIDFPSLTTVSGSSCLQRMFSACSYLTNVSFYALSNLGDYANYFNNMLRSCSNVTVRFPMAIQSRIGSWSDVTGGFGGTNTTVLFDIVTSLTGADSNTYTRKQKESTSTATAWTYNDTLYYTSGTTEPTVGATIYSDSACTTAVTTIGSIA